MDNIAFVGVCFLFVFLLRDAQLLFDLGTALPRYAYGAYALSIWTGLILVSNLQAATALEIVDKVRSPTVWTVSVGLHLIGLLLCIRLRRVHRSDFSWLIALFPTPVLVLLLAGIAAELTPALSLWMRMGSAAGVAIAWTLLVAGVGALIGKLGGSDSVFAVDFAAVSNSTVLALLPFAPFF